MVPKISGVNYERRVLRETDRQIADIASAVGYESQGKFTRAFKEESGMTPREYRKIQTGA